MKDSFRRILDLVRRTGDRMVVTDPDGDQAFVIMGLDQYEALVDLEEQYFGHLGGDDDFLEGDGNEPTVPPGPPQDSPSATSAAPENPTPDIWDVMAPAESPAESWDYAKLSPEERAQFEAAFEQATKGAVEPKTEPKQEEKKPEDDEPGEEQFYLEPIE